MLPLFPFYKVRWLTDNQAIRRWLIRSVCLSLWLGLSVCLSVCFTFVFSRVLRDSTPRYVILSVGWLVSRSVGWSVGRSVGWSVGWLVSWSPFWAAAPKGWCPLEHKGLLFVRLSVCPFVPPPSPLLHLCKFPMLFNGNSTFFHFSSILHHFTSFASF